MGLKYKLGLISVLIDVIIYVSSAEISQSVFNNYKHPFVMAYIGTSMLLFYLPITLIKEQIKKHLRSHFHQKSNKEVANGSNSMEVQISKEEIELSKTCDDDNERQHSSTNNNQCVINIEPREKGKETVCKCEGGEVDIPKEERKLNTKEVALLALCIGPLWFASEYLTSCALAHTSVASTTILFSTSGLFTLVIDACFKKSINGLNVISVIICMAGVAMTTTAKTWAKDEPTLNQKHSLVGDAFALLSAMADGFYYVLLKKYAGENGQKLDLQKFLGFVGLFVSCLWWLVWPLVALGIEPKFALPKTAKVVEVIVANCFLGNFVADYFWALGAIWTSPLVAALGSSLTIPLAMLTDMLIHGRHYSLLYILGSIQVFVGFIAANLSDWLTPKLRVLFIKAQKSFKGWLRLTRIWDVYEKFIEKLLLRNTFFSNNSKI